MSHRKIFRLVIIIFCLYLIVTTSKAIVDLWRAGDKLTERENRLNALRQTQENLLREKAAAEKPEYWEKMARDQLGLSKKGEDIVIIPQELLVDNTPVASADNTPNWLKWARLFF